MKVGHKWNEPKDMFTNQKPRFQEILKKRTIKGLVDLLAYYNVLFFYFSNFGFC